MAQGNVRGHKDLRVWRESMQLASEIYRRTQALPDDERFGLTAQLRRAATSIPANLAEGAGRGSSPDFARFVAIASGSLSEVETYLLLCEDLGFLSNLDPVHAQVRLLRAMLTKLRTSLLARSARPRLR